MVFLKYLIGDFLFDGNPLSKLGLVSVSVFTELSRFSSKFAKLIAGIEIGAVWDSGFSSGFAPGIFGMDGNPGSILGTDPAREAIGLCIG